MKITISGIEYTAVEDDLDSVVFVNLTPHALVLRDSREEERSFPPSGHVARRGVKEKEEIQFERMTVISRAWGPVEGLPPKAAEKLNIIYLVSSIVLDGVSPDRCDVFAPDTGSSAIRGADGQIMAVTRLVSPS